MVSIREMGIFYRRDSSYSGESSRAIPHSYQGEWAVGQERRPPCHYRCNSRHTGTYGGP